jgi:hypothetical protein
VNVFFEAIRDKSLVCVDISSVGPQRKSGGIKSGDLVSQRSFRDNLVSKRFGAPCPGLYGHWE